MDLRTRLLLAWLEGEGERRRRKLPLPPVVGDAPARGWPHLSVCVLGGVLAAGLFVCWLAKARHESGLDARRADAANRFLRAGTAITLADVRVEGIDRGIKGARSRSPVTLFLNKNGLLIVCEFRAENAPRNVGAGDTVTVRASARDEGQPDCVLFRDCEIVEPFFLPGK